MSHLNVRRLSNASFTRPRRLSNVSYLPISAVSAGAPQTKYFYDRDDIREHGLGIVTAAIFLAGEMAGTGVLALPAAMIGTGWAGLCLIVLFTLNACFSGTRLGLCWVILEERFPEFKGIIRDPYPTIGEKAVGKWGRVLSLLCISLTLYGAGCVFIVLIAQLFASILSQWAGVHMGLCLWMVIVAICLTPLTWMGTPKDFWPIAVGALLTTVAACILIMVQALLDFSASSASATNAEVSPVEYPMPTVEGSFKAFGSIMFAFAGASTFPTIQADMRQREKFNTSAIIACIILFVIYFPMAAVPYFSYGGRAQPNIVLTMAPGVIRVVVEVMLLLHLIAAFPIILNPPAQFFEYMLHIPSDFNWKRCAFRSLSVLGLLFIAETIPSFGSILDLVGASTVTLLTFVFPPYFYMRLCDDSSSNKEWKQRQLPLWERCYCWFLIVLGFAGGAVATYTAVRNIVSADFKVPCYLQEMGPVGGNHTLEFSGH